MKTLTKEDIAALRKASSVSFGVAELGDPGRIVASVDGKDVGPFKSEGSLTRLIEVGASPGTTGSEHLGSCNFHRPWMTVAGMLKPGDALEIEFKPDDITSELLGEHALHGDLLYINVTRTGRKARRMTFLIASHVSLDNSARMCRKAS